MTVVMCDVVFDGANELGHASKGAPANAFASDLGEPTLDQIDPRSVGRYEVTVIARMGIEPRVDRRGGPSGSMTLRTSPRLADGAQLPGNEFLNLL
jgi:hypothetical protein